MLLFGLSLKNYAQEQDSFEPAAMKDSVLTNDVPITIDTIEKLSKKELRKIRLDTLQDCFSCKDIYPKKVAMYAGICPGLGQIYNRKYWKLPLVYGGLGVGVYFIGSTTKNLRIYNQALTLRLDANPDTQDQFENILTDDQLYSFRDYYRRNVQLAVFGTVLWWGISVIDASVDAHLKSFDISDDLSMKIRPSFLTVGNTPFPSVNVSLRWH